MLKRKYLLNLINKHIVWRDNMRIGIIDSGMGGLMVLQRIKEKHPNHHYIYFGDTAHLPYGEKTKEQLLDYSISIIDFLLTKDVDLIILACGTLSSTIYEDLKQKYMVSIMDVIHPAIDFLNQKEYPSVGVIGTTVTIQSKIFEQHSNTEIRSIACPKFVPLIENGMIDSKNMKEAVEEYLSPFKEQSIDALVLGCTHYPMIQTQIREYLNKNIEYIDLGQIIADKIPLSKEATGQTELYFSRVEDKMINQVKSTIGNYPVVEIKL